MLGFDYNNYLVTQKWDGLAFDNVALESFVLPLNTWTHVAATYSFTNGLRLFINGTLANMTSSNYYNAASGSLNIMSVGACTPLVWCSNAQTRIVPSQYRGKIDEMRIYSRELTIAEIQALVNV